MLTQSQFDDLNEMKKKKYVLERTLEHISTTSPGHIVPGDSGDDSIEYWFQDFQYDVKSFKESWIEAELKKLNANIGFYIRS